jgi:type VI secretion system protein ImpE
MTATELYKAGKLQEAISAQVQEVKSHPADHAKRLFLFELLAFAGDLERARKHIDVVNYGDLGLDAAVVSYRKLLDAEQARRRFFHEGVRPEFLAEPPEHVSLRLEAVDRLREGRPADAAALLARADAGAPGHLRGQLNGKPFDALRDADDLFGTVLEVMAHGSYYWVPLEQVVTLAMNPPRFPRDLLWVPARLELQGAAGDVFLPALYPGSHEHPDDQLKLARGTDWKSAEGGPVQGVGLHTFLVGEDPVSLLEWRQLEVEAPAAAAS